MENSIQLWQLQMLLSVLGSESSFSIYFNEKLDMPNQKFMENTLKYNKTLKLFYELLINSFVQFGY